MKEMFETENALKSILNEITPHHRMIDKSRRINYIQKKLYIYYMRVKLQNKPETVGDRITVMSNFN